MSRTLGFSFLFLSLASLTVTPARCAEPKNSIPEASKGTKKSAPTLQKDKPTASEALFLDRLMRVESGGRLHAKNPRSSAYGPFQFIHSTFYDVITRHFPKLADGKSYAEIQKMRSDLKISRKAALLYTRENAIFLNKRGHKPEPGFLRLAFLLGPSGAANVIAAKPKTPLSNLLSASAIQANPFLRRMTAEQLIERARREAAGLKPLPVPASLQAAKQHPQIKVRCNLRRASCRKWLALAKKRLARKLASQKRD